MIRLKNINYNELRELYLEKIAEAGIVKFDKDDILGIESSNKKTQSEETYDILSNGSNYLIKIRKYLFLNDDKSSVNQTRLQEMLAGPKELPKTFGGERYESLYSFLNKMKQDLGECYSKEDRKALSKIFCYEKFHDNKKAKEVSYWLIRTLHQETCPYCNIGYITIIEGRKSFRSAFDHYLPHSLYPYLGVCLFNLIPACTTCNTLKSAQKNDVIYPYEESFDEGDKHYSFYLESDKGHPEVWSGNSDSFTIYFVDEEKRKIDTRTIVKDAYLQKVINSINTFELESVYTKCHKDEIRKLLYNHYVYNENHVKMLKYSYSNHGMNKYINESIRELLYFAYLQYGDWGRSPLNKLKYDLLCQLDQQINQGFEE